MNFSCPTGAFGNGTAGLLCKLMGLPIDRLLIATNENDILHRYFSTGVFEKTAVQATITPAIDIQGPYNIERFIYMLTNGDSKRVKEWMLKFEKEGKVKMDDKVWNAAKEHVISTSIPAKETLSTIEKYYKSSGYILDPHTAVGVRAAERLKSDGTLGNSPVVSMGTAHPSKFNPTIKKAIGLEAPLPPVLQKIVGAPTKVIPFGPDKSQAERKLRSLIEQAFNRPVAKL